MKHLKLFFACMLLAVLSIGQVWGETTTYQHIFSAKPSTGNNVALSSVKWNISATQLGNYNSSNYAGVQLGTSKANGSITLTSSSNWGGEEGTYKDKTVITEVRLWLNLGGTSVTPSVTIGGVAATSDGTTVVKNSSAGSDYTKATKVTFTPADNGNTGQVVISVSTVKAGYICAMEIDCEESGGDESEEPAVPADHLAWSASSAKVFKTGETYDEHVAHNNLPGLTYDLEATLTFESTNTAVATISDAGVVSIKDAGTTTIKATYPADATYSETTVSYTLTVDEILTVAGARAVIDGGTNLTGRYVKGIVTKIDNNTDATYWLADDGIATNQFEVYKGKGIDGAALTAQTLQIGDLVVIKGTLKKYNTTYEFDSNSQQVSSVRKALDHITVATAPTTLTYKEGQDFDPTGLVITLHYDNSTTEDVTYADNESDFAFSPSTNLEYSASPVAVTITYKGDKTTTQNITVNQKDKFKVTITEPTNGSVVIKNGNDAIVSGVTEIVEGTTLTIEATPNTNYSVDKIYVNEVEQAVYTFTLNANTTVNVTFKEDERPVAKLYLVDANGNGEFAGSYKVNDKVTLPDDAATCNGKTFVGWSEEAIATPVDAKPTAKFHEPGEENFTLAAEEQTLYAVYKTEVAGSTVTKSDELTYSLIGVSGTSYSDWSKKTATNEGHSDAVYAGQSAGGNTSIQIRAKNSNSGIITTTSGGNLKKVTITWNSNATVGRYVTVCAKNSAYASAADLFGENKGTELGTIVAGTSTELTVTGDFTHFGIRANDAIYMDKVTVVWEAAGPASYTYSTTCSPKLDAPTFSPASGSTFDVATDITISGPDGATIYYVVNEEEITEQNRTEYTQAITLSDNRVYTIKAIAVKANCDDSDVATATYTVDKPYTSISAVIDANLSASDDVKLNFVSASEAIITAVNGTNRYVQDASGKGIVIRSSNWDDAAIAGKKIAAKITGKWAVYEGQVQINEAVFTDATFETATLPAAFDYDETKSLAENFADHATALVKVTGVAFASEDLDNNGKVVLNKNTEPLVTLKDGVYVLRDKNNSYAQIKTLPLANTPCDVTGMLVYYEKNTESEYQLIPVNLAAIDTKGATAVLPTFDAGNTDAENPAIVAEGKVISFELATGYNAVYAVNDAEEAPITAQTQVTINDTENATKLYVKATRDFYADNAVTYYYKANSAISEKAVNCATELEGGSISANPVSAVAGTPITLTATPDDHFTFGSWTVTYVDGESVEQTITPDANNQFEMPAYNVNVSATFMEDAYANATFVGGEETSGNAPDVQKKYVGEKVSVPGKNTLAKSGYSFAGWTMGGNDYVEGDEYTIQTADAANGGKTLTFTAKWEVLPVWATTYTSNVTVGDDVIKFSNETDAPTYKAKKAGTSSAAGSTKVTVLAGTTKLHFHAAGWYSEKVTIAVKKGETTIQSFVIPQDAGMTGNSPFTLVNDPAATEYFAVPLTEITEETEITFEATNGKRFAIYGVNAEYPASITLDPASHNFGNVLNNGQATREFTIIPNAMVTGDIEASIIEASAENVFSVGTISDNKVTVTFAPNAETEFTAKLKVASGTTNVTANLSGTGIPATTPEITVDKTAVNFGTIIQDENAGTQTVSVTMTNIDAEGVSAAITGTVFTLDKNKLTTNSEIVISANTATAGEYSETLTLSATGAANKQVTVTMTVGSKWAHTYTSNITVGNDKVVIGGTQYEAQKTGSSSSSGSTTVEVPAYTETLHFHAAGWGADNIVNLEVKKGSTILGTFNLTQDAGVKSNSPYTLAGTPSEQYYSVALSEISEATEITFEALSTGGKRFVIYGVNQEGGILPILDRIEITGEATNLDYTVGDEFNPAGLGANAIYKFLGEDQDPVAIPAADIEWSFDPAYIAATTQSVTVTATYKGKSANTVVSGLQVTIPDPEITVSESEIAFGTIALNAAAVKKSVNVTIKSVANATISLSGAGASAFSINKSSLSASGTITITAKTNAEGTFAATLTISDNVGAAEAKTIALSSKVMDIPYWATVYKSNVTLSGTGSTVAMVNINGKEYNARKAGTKDVSGEVTVKVPRGAHTLHFHCAAWKDKGTATIAVEGVNVTSESSSTFNDIAEDAGVSGNSPFILAGEAYEQYRTFEFNPVEANTTIRFSRTDGDDNRFVIYGVNQEGGVWEVEEDNMDQDAVPDNADIEIGTDKTWTITEDKEVGNLYMNEGAIIANSAEVTTKDLYFSSKAGKSNQVIDASQLTVVGDFYYDYQLCDDALDPDYWYSVAVPFDVDVNSGVYKKEGSVVTQLTYRSDFEVWEYDTYKRAQTMSNGWKRLTGNRMQAGRAYLIGFNPGTPNVIRFKATDDWKDNLFSGTAMNLISAAASDGTHSNWNGIANPTTHYASVNLDVQVFDNNSHSFSSFSHTSYTFVVGTAFFVQATGTIDLGNDDNGQYRAPKRANENYEYSVRISKAEASNFDNQIIVRASEEATTSYEQGHDMLTMNDATSRTAALLWTKNYGGKRLAIEEAPMADGLAQYALGVYAPANGTYIISVAKVQENVDLYLTKDGAIIWNLSMSACTLDLNKGNNEGYGLILQAKAPNATTGCENIDASEAAQKVIIDNNVYILRNKQMYDVTGKAVK